MMDDDSPNDEILSEFVAESRDALGKVEPLLISLKQQAGSPDADILALIFRCLHSFKGTASFIGLSVTSSLAHSAESLLDLYRRGCSPQASELDILSQTVTLLREMLDVVESEHTDTPKAAAGTALSKRLDEIVEGLRRTHALTFSKRAGYLSWDSIPASQAGVLQTKPPAFSFAAPSLTFQAASPSFHLPSFQAPSHNLQALAAEAITAPRSSLIPEMDEALRQLMAELLPKFVSEADEHLTLVEAALVALECMTADKQQIAEALRAMHSLKSNSGICGIGDLEQLIHSAETLLDKIQADAATATPEVISLLLEVVAVSRQTLATVNFGDTSNFGNTRVPNSAQLLRQLRSALQSSASSIRVDTQKLDLLTQLVAELVAAETALTKNPDLEGYEFENFQQAALKLNRITCCLQEVAIAVRRVPLAATFKNMLRLVRDVSTEQQTTVELIISDEDTEVDISVVETISDSLLQLIRGALDHGIESSEERLANGKSSAGHIWLDARQQAGEVWITLRDDGRGLEPRGIGIDVVKRNIESAGGRVEIATQVGLGTTFTLRIPATSVSLQGRAVPACTAAISV